jgi:undecaprenyl-diphosphatase
MMSTLEAVLLGMIQGLTEFLPVSSSGHLVVFQNLLGFREPELLLDSSLHLGTLAAVCLYFRVDLKEMVRDSWGFLKRWSGREVRFQDIKKTPYAGLALAVVVGTLPTALIGILFRSSIEKLFGSMSFAGVMLLCTGAILLFSRWISHERTGVKAPGIMSALLVGTAQGIAILPGISRSGTTIVCGMACGLSRELAARFSFVLSIPAIMGALVLQWSAVGSERVGLLPLIMGFAAAAVVGMLALKCLMALVRRGNLFYFAPYCLLLGLLIILL